MAFSIELEVMAHDIDVNRLATPSTIVKYFQEAVDANMRCSHPSYQELFDAGRSFIVSRTAVKVLRPLKEYEKLTVSTWATESKSAAFPRSYTIDADGERVAECVMIWALVDINEGKLLRGTELDVSGYGTGELLELDMPSRLRLPKDMAFTQCGSQKVLYRDIDRNRHMNNVKYFDLLFGYIPDCDKYAMTSCLVNYVSEAKWNDMIDIYISEPETAENGELAYYFRTETNGKTNIEARFTLGEI